jgi:hypothetical protein
MKRASVERHPDLFEDDSLQAVVPCDQKQNLVRLIEAMLSEIVTTSLPTMPREGSDDKDLS